MLEFPTLFGDVSFSSSRPDGSPQLQMSRQHSAEGSPLTTPPLTTPPPSPPASKVRGKPPGGDVIAALKQLRQTSTTPSEQKSDTRGFILPQKARQPSGSEEWDLRDYKAWRKYRLLGGGIGKAALFVEVDSSWNIIDRIVVKDTPVNPRTQVGWREDPRKWHGWVAKGKDEDRVPIEWWTHHLASTCPEAKYIIRLRGAPALHRPSFTYRIFVEYASRGSLTEIIDTYFEVNGGVPQQFILFVLKALAECGLIMEQGGIHTLPDNWNQIIHRDLKPDNILLDAARTGDPFHRWPQPKLADFGLSFLTSPSDPGNPILWNYGAGTQGYLPPELKSFHNSKTLQPVHDFKILSPCNVWGVGAVLMNLMQKNSFNDEVQPDYLNTGLGHIGPFQGSYAFTAAEKRRGGYDDGLYELVERCLRVDPARRPGFGELMGYVEGHAMSDQYFGEAARGKQKEDLGLMVSAETEKYKMGFSFWEDSRETYAAFPDAEQRGNADAMMAGMEELDLFL